MRKGQDNNTLNRKEGVDENNTMIISFEAKVRILPVQEGVVVGGV